MSTRTRALTLCLSCLVAVTSACAAELAADSKVARVTVFTDRAEIVRVARVSLAAGANEIRFDGLPLSLEPDSLRVVAHGVPATLGAVELRDDVREPQPSPDAAAAEKEVRALEDAQFAVAQEEKADAEALEYLRALRNPPATAAPATGAATRPDAQAVQLTWTFLRARLDELAARSLARNTRQRELHEKLELARARLNAARPKPGVRLRKVVLALDARSAGALDVELSYVVPRAAWRPAYRASLDPAKGEIDLVTEGVVTQFTGEDWSDVDLQLSTATPARGVEPPPLVRLVVAPASINELPVGRDFKSAVTFAPGVAAPAPQDAMYQNTVQSEESNVVVAKAQLLRTAYSTVFVVPGKAAIPADAREHRVLLRSGSMPVTLAYRVHPAAPAAYVVARGKSSPDWPMLAGPVRVFAGTAYVGEVFHAESGPGAEVELPFGVDDRVAVKRIALPEQQTREGFTNKDAQVLRHVSTRLQNRRDQPVRVIVRDRIPVSQDERIVVKRTEATTPGAKEVADAPGLWEWEVALAPGEAKEVVVEYTIRHPRDLEISEDERP